jgi:hypothetical protein
MVLSMAFGLAMAEIVLREEKMSEETTCILKSERLSKGGASRDFLNKKSSEATVRDKCRQ